MRIMITEAHNISDMTDSLMTSLFANEFAVMFKLTYRGVKNTDIRPKRSIQVC